MNLTAEIKEVINLLNEALATVTDNMVYEQYKSRVIANYSQALKSLVDVQRGENKGWQE